MGRGATGAIAALGDLGGNQGPGAGKFYGSAWTVSARSRSNIHRIYVFTYLRIYVYPTGSQGPQALDPRQYSQQEPAPGRRALWLRARCTAGGKI